MRLYIPALHHSNDFHRSIPSPQQRLMATNKAVHYSQDAQGSPGQLTLCCGHLICLVANHALCRYWPVSQTSGFPDPAVLSVTPLAMPPYFNASPCNGLPPTNLAGTGLSVRLAASPTLPSSASRLRRSPALSLTQSPTGGQAALTRGRPSPSTTLRRASPSTCPSPRR